MEIELDLQKQELLALDIFGFIPLIAPHFQGDRMTIERSL